MLKEFLLFIKYPYTAGVIGIVWLGSTIFRWLLIVFLARCPEKQSVCYLSGDHDCGWHSLCDFNFPLVAFHAARKKLSNLKV